MNRYRLLLAGLILAGVGTLAGTRLLYFAQAQAPSPLVPQAAGNQPALAPPAMDTGIRLLTNMYVKAFNNRDAKAAAMLWTTNGVFVGIDGVEVRGRAAIQQTLANDFKEFPNDRMAIQITSIRPLSANTALVEGAITVTNPNAATPIDTRYSALEVFENGLWLTASAREWIGNPERSASRRFLDWLVGRWTAVGAGGIFTVNYNWDETKTYLLGKYTLTRDGTTISAGTEIFSLTQVGGGLRSWTFDNSGSYSAGFWVREGQNWVDEAAGVFPDGVSIQTENVLTPLGPNSFLWQTPTRVSDQVELSPLLPIKFTRVVP